MSEIGIVGPGRAGLGLALALTQAGHEVWLHGRRGKVVPPPLRLSWGGVPPWLSRVDVILVAVRDGAIASAAEELARGGGITPGHIVLHLSGMLDETPLASLRPTGAALGCFHPLQAITRPEMAAERLHGAVAALTGDPRALAAGEQLAHSLAMRPVRLDAGGKPRYHAAAAIASNYLVVLVAAAERLMRDAGLETEAARQGITTLMQGTLANARAEGADALTGPIVRGDVDTVRMHLSVLPPDLRTVYRALGHAALALAGLDAATRERMRAVLDQQPD